MNKPRYLLFVAIFVLALGSLVSASNDDNDLSTTTSAAEKNAEPDEGHVSGQLRQSHGPSRTLPDSDSNDQSDTELPAADSTTDAYPEAASVDSVEGVNRRHSHSCKGNAKKCCNDKGDACEKKKDCCCKHQPTPTYHISICKQDERFKTISLPAQGRPFIYGEDEHHSSPPVVNPFCTHGYCYEPCCQPTGGPYGSLPPQRLHCNHLAPCYPQPPPPPPCCCPPPPPCGCCPPPPCCCPPPPNCGCCPPPPPPPCCDCPPPCCDYCPPPPYVYDECLDKKHKKHKGHKKGSKYD